MKATKQSLLKQTRIRVAVQGLSQVELDEFRLNGHLTRMAGDRATILSRVVAKYLYPRRKSLVWWQKGYLKSGFAKPIYHSVPSYPTANVL